MRWMKLNYDGFVKNKDNGDVGFILKNDISELLFVRYTFIEKESVFYYKVVVVKDDL